MSETAAINKKVRNILEADGPADATIRWESTGLGESRILRVITEKWKRAPAWQRAWKLQAALEKQLTEKQQEKIFRISVLTGSEFKRLSQSPSGLAAKKNFRAKRRK